MLDKVLVVRVDSSIVYGIDCIVVSYLEIDCFRVVDRQQTRYDYRFRCSEMHDDGMLEDLHMLKECDEGKRQ